MIFKNRIEESFYKRMEQQGEVLKQQLQKEFQKIMDGAVNHFNSRVKTLEQDVKQFIKEEIKEQLENKFNERIKNV